MLVAPLPIWKLLIGCQTPSGLPLALLNVPLLVVGWYLQPCDIFPGGCLYSLIKCLPEGCHYPVARRYRELGVRVLYKIISRVVASGQWMSPREMSRRLPKLHARGAAFRHYIRKTLKLINNLKSVS